MKTLLDFTIFAVAGPQQYRSWEQAQWLLLSLKTSLYRAQKVILGDMGAVQRIAANLFNFDIARHQNAVKSHQYKDLHEND